MFVLIESFLAVVLEMFCCKIFYEVFGEKRKNKWWQECVYTIILIMTAYFSAMLFANQMIIKVILVILEISIIMHFDLCLSFIKSLILAVFFEGLLLVADLFTFLLSITIFENTEIINNEYYMEGALLVILGKVILFVIVLLVNRGIGNYSKTDLKDNEWVKFAFIPIFTICIIIAMIMSSGSLDIQDHNYINYIIAFGLAGMNIKISFYVLKRF